MNALPRHRWLGSLLVAAGCVGSEPAASPGPVPEFLVAAPLEPVVAPPSEPPATASPAPFSTRTPRERMTAACAAAGRPVEPFEPLLARFETALGTRMALSSDATWTYLALETTAKGPEAEAALASLLADAGVSHDDIVLVGALLEEHGHPGFSVAIEVSDEPARIHLVWETKGDATTAARFASRVGAPGLLESILHLARTLLVGDLERLGVTLEAGAKPRFEKTYHWSVYADMRETFARRLVDAGDELGILRAATEFQGEMLPAFAPMAARDLRLTTSFADRSMDPRLAVGFPGVPHRLVLKVMAYHGPDETNRGRMEGLIAAVAADRDLAGWVTIEAWKSDLPRVHFVLEGYDDGPPPH